MGSGGPLAHKARQLPAPSRESRWHVNSINARNGSFSAWGAPKVPRCHSSDIMRRFGFFVLLLGSAALLGACNHSASDERAASAASASAAASSSAAPRAPSHAPRAGEVVDIPGGAFLSGSRPGSPGRVPSLEAELYELELGPFQIDKLPFPNDPNKSPLVNVSRKEAQRHCAEQGGRLCTELEWERACKGPNSDPYATGSAWSERCAKEPSTCASGFDVLGMGSIREWTASVVAPRARDSESSAAIRGAAPDTPPGAHGCARRGALAADAKASDLGFRCCKGAPNGAVAPEPKEGATYKKVRIEAKKLEEVLARYPQTKQIAKDIVFFHDPEGAATVVARGPGDRKGFSFTVSPLLWNPVAGGRYLLVPARSGKRTSFVVALYPSGKSDYALAASFIMENEPGPVALAYDEYIRPRAHFSTCWGCPGETGKILYREHDNVAILQP